MMDTQNRQQFALVHFSAKETLDFLREPGAEVVGPQTLHCFVLIVVSNAETVAAQQRVSVLGVCMFGFQCFLPLRQAYRRDSM